MNRRMIVAAAVLAVGLATISVGVYFLAPEPKPAPPAKSDQEQLRATLNEAQTIEREHLAATGTAKYDPDEVWLPGLHTPNGASVSLETKGRWYCIRGELNGLVLYLRSDPPGITAVAC
jgi:hypothetical protein